MTGPVPPLTRLRDAPISAVVHRLMPFYRRFPYSGPMAITKVDPRGVAIPTEQIFYNRVPKAANSTIVKVLAEHSDYAQAFAGRRAKSRFLRPSRMSAGMVAELDRDWFKVTLVRHPMTRALSAYLDKVVGRKAQSRPFFRWFGTGREPVFADFCRYLDVGGLWHDMHWAPQTGILLLPLERFDMIGRFERLEADLAVIVEKGFGEGTELRMRRAGPRPTGADQSRAAHLTEEAREILARLYAEDFRAFGYDPSA